MNTLGKRTKDINDKINIKKITNFSISFQLYTVYSAVKRQRF